MNPQNYAGIDFRGFITEKTQSFTGRGWVFAEVNQWLSPATASRFLFLNGKPGSGKTAIAARLCQFALGEATPPDGLSFLQSKNFITAYHFCSARDSNWIDPRSFVWSVALQLAKSHEEFAKALVTAGDKPVNLTGEANAQVADENAVVAGVIIKNLSLSGMSSQEAFNRFLVGPLQTIYQQGFSKPITILVDSLDESLQHSGSVTIAALLARVKSLPVRFIVTSRDDDRLMADFLLDATLLPISESDHKSDNDNDIAEFVKLQISQLTDLKKKEEALSETDRRQLIDTIVQRAEGNFLYVAFLLDSLAMPQHPLSDLDSLPSGLEGLYYDSIKRVVDLGGGIWETDYSPLLGVLSVAQSPLNIDQIEQFTGKAANEVWSGVNDLLQFIAKNDTSSDPLKPVLVYRLYHQSVIDFLSTPQLRINNKLINNTYLLRPLDWHLGIVNYYASEADWSQWDDYGIRYFATHLAEAAKQSKRPQQQQQVERLVDFVCNRDFWQLHKQRINDLALLQRDLERALKVAAANSDPKGLASLVRVATTITTFRREELRPEPLFDLARQGEIAGAASRLDLFDIDADWKLIALLVMGWLAVYVTPEEAHRLRDQVKDATIYTPSVGSLIARLNLELDNTPLTLASLPDPPTEEVARELVSNLGGNAVNVELLSIQHGPSDPAMVPFADGPDSEPGYFAEHDAPLLVAYAQAHRPDGDKYFRQYVAIHTSYNYVQYRNRSLLHLLEAVLRSPGEFWEQEMCVLLASAALAGNTTEFQEGLPFTILGIRAASNAPQLNLRREQLIDDSEKLNRERGEGDSWGFFRRRLGSLAQVYAVLSKDQSAAGDLLERAIDLPYGFAGFNAPASLFLAEATQICQPDNQALIERFLTAALSSAHNIQDIIFCARSTARVNAMRQRWWGPAFSNVGNFIAQMCDNPSALEFTALHYVGEEYKTREAPPKSAELPFWFRQANTLSELASVYQRPLSDFLRVNRQAGWSEHQILTVGTEVNVPDAGFATQLAARFAAEVLSDPALTQPQRVSLIQQLVPLASLSPTALDTVLARLLLAAQPADEGTLSSIERFANDSVVKFQPASSAETYQIFYPHA